MLGGQQWRKLNEALTAAFPNYDYLQMFLQQELEVPLASISPPKGMPFVVYDVIQYAEAHNRTAELVEAARRNRPQDPELYALAQELKVAPQTDNLERLLNQENIVFDVATFRNKVAEIESSVCRIELAGQPEGTGFLVGPSAVMTNYHVVEKVINGSLSPEDVRLRFDYKLLDDGTTINSGTIHELASGAEWLIDSSPYSEVDKYAEPKTEVPAPDELDYVVLRTQSKAAEDEVGKMGMVGLGFATARGFIELPSPAKDHDFQANKVLFIVQHPLGNPMKITANTFRSMNDNQTRVTYLNETERGSSGSACFSANWELVALHHSGDPDYEQPEYNQGIPMHAIVNLLQDRDRLKDIGPEA
jgi:hypothetical protein